MTLLTGFGNEESFIRILLTHFEARISDAEAFALRRRVLLLKSDTGIGIDIALGALDFEQSVVRRASVYEFLPGIKLRICSVEDLVIHKAFADRPQDWIDIEGVLIRQKGRLDWRYIYAQLIPLVELKEQPEILEKLGNLQAKIT